MAILKKADFVKKVSEEAGVSQEQVKNVLEAIDTISLNSLKEGHKVSIGKMINLSPVAKKATSGVSAFNGKSWEKPAHTAIKSEITKAFRQL